jgi:hypothetical protein
MTEEIDSYFENMGETLVGALSRNWSGDLRADAQVWLAAKARQAQARSEPSPSPAAGPYAAMAVERQLARKASTRAAIVPTIVTVSLIANIMMFAYLIH